MSNEYRGKVLKHKMVHARNVIEHENTESWIIEMDGRKESQVSDIKPRSSTRREKGSSHQGIIHIYRYKTHTEYQRNKASK